MRRRSFLKACGGVALTGWAARSAAADLPARSDLDGDVAIVRQALTLHPGLHRYQSPREAERRLEMFAAEYTRAGDMAGRYLALARLTAAIRCGHSYGNFFNQKTAVQAALFDRPTRLPFLFVWVDRAMVVTSDPSGILARGTRIKRMNGFDPAMLRDRLIPLTRGDGHNDAKRVSLLEVRGDDEFETFDVLQGLVAPPESGTHQLEALTAGGKRRALALPAIALAARQKMMRASPSDRDGAVWSWVMRPDGIAVLTMPGWALWDSKWDWKSWLSERLDSLEGARGLVIDLRDNEGGDERCGAAILARLIDRPVATNDWEQRLRFQRTPPALDPYLDTWDASFRTLGEGAAAIGGGFYRRPPSAEDAMLVTPAGKRLTLPVRVLVSPVNSSATFQFASTVQRLGLGRLVGGPTGGNRRGINGGSFFFVRLPASGLEFDLPLIGYFPRSAQPDAGLIPDLLARPGIADIARGHDRVLAAALVDIARG